ncbi:MAG: hypothetical protein GXY20_04395 [Clostridiales bacterium]|nr:hypothetical protein [Clostridiales bacterium]
MGDYVLFSAIGTSDPIRGNFDGPMLHVVRHYRPKKVYLFFTEEMSQRVDEFGYEWCVKQLCPECEVVVILTDIENAHDYSVFINEFPKHIERIRDENKGATLILTVSSGTQQMCSCLALEALSRGLLAVQVSTPEKGASFSKRVYKGFEYQQAFENDFDNGVAGETENRCREPDLSYYRHIIVKSQIRELINVYDYHGALRLAKSELSGNIRLIRELESVILRLQMKTDEAEAKTSDKSLFPVKKSTYREKRCRILSEYLLVMFHKTLIVSIDDFSLRLTPFLQQLIADYLEFVFGFKIKEYIVKNNIIPDRFPPEMRAFVESEIGAELKGHKMSLLLMVSLFKYHAGTEDVDSILFSGLLNGNRLRNDVAHSLTGLTEDEFEEGYGLTPKLLVHKLFGIMKKVYGTHAKISPEQYAEKITAVLLEVVG